MLSSINYLNLYLYHVKYNTIKSDIKNTLPQCLALSTCLPFPYVNRGLQLYSDDYYKLIIIITLFHTISNCY